MTRRIRTGLEQRPYYSKNLLHFTYVMAKNRKATPLPQQTTSGNIPAPQFHPTPTATPIQQLHGEGKQKASVDPKNWTVEDVASWLGSRGFDQDVCDRFTGVFLPWLVQHHAD